MIFYENEIKALKKSSRFRQRNIVDYNIKDFSSNDYLGLAHNANIHRLTCDTLGKTQVYSSKASMLVDGYHQIHKDFEKELCSVNGFEDAIITGSGFNTNIALVEALVRKGDTLFMDEKYHASGILASKINTIDVKFFKHNDMNELKKLLDNSQAKRNIVAVEGIYSMSGDICPREIFDICENAILIVDEAHSSGVIGDKLCGIFDFYKIEIKPNHIKMGTLGKAYGSFGAYILASFHLIEYLINRAKPIIYATALSLYDTLYAHNSLRFIQKNLLNIKNKIKKHKDIIYEELGLEIDGLIVQILIGNNEKAMKIKDNIYESGYSIGGIREPTVSSAIIRLIARIEQEPNELRILCKKLAKIL